MPNKIENKDKLNTFKDMVGMLVNDCLILSIREKEEIIKTLPILELADLIELFNLLTGSKKNVDEILAALSKDYPNVMTDLNDFQIETLKSIYKGGREMLKTKINNL